MKRKHPGFFMVLEGPDGSGKTTLLPDLVGHLKGLGLNVYPTREPGGTSIGEQIREVLHKNKNIEMSPRTETLLYQAARAQLVDEVIRPRLDNGEIILLDRFLDSTLAYQGYGHRQDIDTLRYLIRYATLGLVPDLAILLDVEPEIGLERRKKEGLEWNRLDAYPPDFHDRVRKGYLLMANESPDYWLIVDANKSLDEVRSRLFREVDSKLVSEGLIERRRLGPER